MREIISKYFNSLFAAYKDGGTEHSGRTALENLLNELKPQNVQIKHEPGRQGNKGAPDYKVMRKGRRLGYIENKAPGVNLDKVLKSEQIKNYVALSDNLIITDYLQWIWLRDGKIIMRETIAYKDDLQNKSFSPSEEKIAVLGKMLEGFFGVKAEPIASPEILAEKLAVRALYLRDALTLELTRQQKEKTGGKLYALYEVFRNQVFHELTLQEFADAFAQMLAYSLFLARLNAKENQIIDLHNVKGFIPNSFSLIRELSDFLDEMESDEYADIRWVIDEILSLINNLDLSEIISALSFQGRKVRRGIKAKDEEEARLFERDPYIYFYEDFLHKYDPKTKETRGVYYTPPPVVNFIVRAIDDILKDIFYINHGLAEHKRVTVLDFASGTGTFLLEVLEQIFANIGGANAGLADLIVREHILKNIYGFEFLLAPYTIAHLKLSQYLADKGHKLTDNQRLGIYLTNTLEPIEPQYEAFLPALSKEVELAQEVKDKPILVITGNPPYSGHSKNKGKWISAAIDEYKMADGRPLGEKNPKWLNDDYVKFIRFAQMKMDKVDEGVVGIITNHSFIDNPTFRGMRQSLMKSFDQIYILDLHGNSKKREVAPDGSVDQNVFDIQQGVAISLFIKTKGGNISPDISSSYPTSPSASPTSPSANPISSSSGLTRGSNQQQKEAKVDTRVKREYDEARVTNNNQRTGKIFHADLWGKRLDKYKASARETIKSVEWLELKPVSPFYLFIPQDRDLWGEYEKGWKVTDIFPVNVLGFQTHRDHFAIGFERSDIEQRIKDMLKDGLSDDQLREKYKLRDNRDWQLDKAREKLTAIQEPDDKIIECAYRPFEKRWCFFGYETMDYPRRDLLDHVAWRENVCLGIGRFGDAVPERPWELITIFDRPADANLYRRGGVNCFPLYLYPSDNAKRIENIAPDFRNWIDEKYQHHFNPEAIMAYIYAILHAPTYRQKYAEFLRIDFPHVAFPEAQEQFELLAELGQELMEAHLMRNRPQLGLGAYNGKGSHEVEKVRFVEEKAQLYINKTQYFAPVPKDVWQFHIGGYQVLDKYLKSRKGRTLSLDEINNISNICNILAFTIKQMQKIDDAYNKAFGEGC